MFLASRCHHRGMDLDLWDRRLIVRGWWIRAEHSLQTDSLRPAPLEVIEDAQVVLDGSLNCANERRAFPKNGDLISCDEWRILEAGVRDLLIASYVVS